MDKQDAGVEDGIRQIAEFIREGDLDTARTAFELLSGGLAVFASPAQLGRMRRLANSLSVEFAVGGEGPEWSAEEAAPSGFGMH